MKTLLRAAGVNEHSDGVYGGICVPCIYFLACSVGVPVGDSGLCCCVRVTSSERQLTHPRTNSLRLSILMLHYDKAKTT